MNSSQLIDQQITKFPDWRGKTMTQLRKAILKAEPAITEEWKWGTGVWTHNGLVCAVSAFKDHVKINFFKGALLKDPQKILNAGFDSKLHRAVDFFEKDKVNTIAIQKLVKAAVLQNTKKQ